MRSNNLTKQNTKPVQKEKDPYTIGKEISRGTYGVVYKGTFTNWYASPSYQIPKPAAIKVMLNNNYANTFKKEKAILGIISDKNHELQYRYEDDFGCLVRCYGSYVKASQWGTESLVIVFELALCDLSTWLERTKNNPVDWTITYPLMKNLACALYVLQIHCEIIHRDLKPSNVLMFKNEKGQWKAKIADFGLSIVKGENQSKGVGTPLYEAPEILNSQPNTFSSDIYSFATILWEMATGGEQIHSNAYPKHMGRDEATLKTQIWACQKTSKVPANCPEKMKRLIPWCFTFKPENRPDATVIRDEFSTDLNIISENLHRRPT